MFEGQAGFLRDFSCLQQVAQISIGDYAGFKLESGGEIFRRMSKI